MREKKTSDNIIQWQAQRLDYPTTVSGFYVSLKRSSKHKRNVVLSTLLFTWVSYPKYSLLILSAQFQLMFSPVPMLSNTEGASNCLYGHKCCQLAGKSSWLICQYFIVLISQNACSLSPQCHLNTHVPMLFVDCVGATANYGEFWRTARICITLLFKSLTTLHIHYIFAYLIPAICQRN